MTFVSALFSRTHFNANYFAVLNESFKVISLFSYQSSLFRCLCDSFYILSKAFVFVNNFFIFLCCRFKRQPVHLITSDRLCQQLFFFVVVSSDSLFILPPAIGFVNNFFFPSRSFSRTDCRIPCRLLSLLFFCMCRRISDSLLIIALLPAEVNTFRADLSK